MRRGRDRSVDPQRLLSDVRVDRAVSKRGTITFARGNRAVVLPNGGPVLAGRALLLAPGEDNHEPDQPPATLCLDRAALLDYAAVLLAAVAELPEEKP